MGDDGPGENRAGLQAIVLRTALGIVISGVRVVDEVRRILHAEEREAALIGDDARRAQIAEARDELERLTG